MATLFTAARVSSCVKPLASVGLELGVNVSLFVAELFVGLYCVKSLYAVVCLEGVFVLLVVVSVCGFQTSAVFTVEGGPVVALLLGCVTVARLSSAASGRAFV